VTLNGKKVTDADQFRLQVAEIEPGKTIDLGVLRSGKKMELKVKLGERSKLLTATPQEKPQKQQQEEKDWLGIQVETATEDLASQFGVAYTKGVIVTGVDQGSIADDSGIQPGDIISEIDRKQILNKEDYTRIIKGLKDRKKAIAFLISRKGTTFYLVVKPE
jgi:serine protease Do